MRKSEKDEEEMEEFVRKRATGNEEELVLLLPTPCIRDDKFGGTYKVTRRE